MTGATFPDGWIRLPFGNVATLQRGFDLPVQDRTPGPFPVIGSNGVVGFHKEPKLHGPGVVIGRSGTIGKSFYTEGAYWPLNTGLFVKDFHGNEPLFIHFLFQAFDFGKYSAGVSVPTLNRNLLHGVILSIPSLPEQRAIAALLSKIHAAVEVHGKVVATLKKLKAATMAKFFREGLRGEGVKQTEIGEIPESWEVLPLRSLLREPLRNGHSAKVSPDGHGVRALTLTAVTRREFSAANTKITSADPSGVRDLWLNDGDVFVERANTVEMVGLAALYRGPANFAIFPDLLIRVRVRADRLLPELLTEWLLMPWCRSYFQRHCHGAATSMPKIDHQTIENVLIPVPDMQEQEALASAISALDRRVQAASRRVDVLRSLFLSMLELLMTGQVRIPPKMIALQAAADRAKQRKKNGKPADEQTIQEIVRRIVEAVAPEKIILFGSGARGQMGADSDLDFLVVKSCVNRREAAQIIYERLRGIGIPKDIVVVTPEDVERHKDTIGLIIRPALREGRVLYAA